MPVALHHPSVTSHRCASYIDRSLSGLLKHRRLDPWISPGLFALVAQNQLY